MTMDNYKLEREMLMQNNSVVLEIVKENLHDDIASDLHAIEYPAFQDVLKRYVVIIMKDDIGDHISKAVQLPGITQEFCVTHFLVGKITEFYKEIWGIKT